MVLVQTVINFIAWAWSHRTEITILGAVGFLLRELSKQLVKSQLNKHLNKIFGNTDLQRIESKLDYLIALEGGNWNNGRSRTYESAEVLSLKRLLFGCCAAILRKTFNFPRRIKKMPNINKALLGPLVSTILLIIKTATGYEVPVVWADMGVDFILSVYTIYGFFLHPTNEPITGRINKSLIMPIFAAVGLIFSLVTHHTVSNDLVSALADFVVYGVTLWGQFMHPVRQDQPAVQQPNSKNFIQG